MSAVYKKAVKLNHSPTFLCVLHYIYYLLLYELLFFAISQICRIRKVCMSFSIWVCRTLFSRHVILMVRDVLVEIFWICGVQLRCPSIVRPRKLHSVTLSIGSEFIASFRGWRIYIALMIMKKHEFCFLTLRNILFILSHSKMLLISLLIFFDISSIMFLADAELLNKHRWLIKICIIWI